MQFEVAADAAVGADGSGDGLLRLVPVAGLPQVVLGGDAGLESTAGYRDGEGVLGDLAARLHALVAQDAARVVADVTVIVVLHRLRDRLGRGAVGRVVLACPGRVPLPGRMRRGRRAVPAGVSAVLLHPAAHFRRGEGQVDGGRQELQHHPPARAHALRVGAHGHAGFGFPRAGRHERPRSLHLHHAYPAHVHRGEVLQVAQGGRVDSLLQARIKQRRALRDAYRLPVDRDVDQPPGRLEEHRAHVGSLPFPPAAALFPPGAAPSIRPRLTAEATAVTAVWPRPQIEASRATAAMSSSRASSCSAEPSGAPCASLLSNSSWRTVPTRHGTHCPQDSSRKNRAIRLRRPCMSTVSSSGRTTPDPSVAPIARTPSNVSGVSSASGPTNEPAAPPSSTARKGRPPRTPPAASSTWRSVTPNSYSYRPGRSTLPDRQNSRVPVELGVPISAKAGPPIRRISGTQSSVSTLLMAVGWPNRPDCAGNGGLLRGSARFPSIELTSAVSSPAM